MKLVFGSVIAVILLGLFVYSVWIAILVVMCVSSGCTRYSLSTFTDGMVQVLTLVGGLVSALVIAEMAITKPGEIPVVQRLANASFITRTIVEIVTGLYLLVWIASGVAAFVVGVMQHPKILQPLTDIGQSWLGVAVAAVYAYFGIEPKSPTERQQKVVA